MLKQILSVNFGIQYISKHLICHYSTHARYKESFQYRILEYFDNKFKVQKELQQFEVSTQVRSILIGNSISDKLEYICKDINNLSSVNSQQKFKILLRDVDARCVSIINILRYSEILNLLNTFLKVVPNGLTNTLFYNKSIFMLTDAVEYGLLSNQEIVQLLFFISLKKENGATYIKYLKPYLPDISVLSLFEKCIIAQCFFKSSLKLEPCQSMVLEKVLEENAEQLIADPLLLVSICKALRISGPSNELTLKNLSDSIVKLNEPFNFTTNIHILALYAALLLPEKNAIIQLVKNSMESIRQDNKCNLRLKDLDRFLWSISYLGLSLKPSNKLILNDYLEKRLKEYKSKENLGIFVNTILCLHILQCWDEKIIENCFQERIFQPILDEIFHWKVRSRLQLLITQVNLEMKIKVPETLKSKIEIRFTPSKNINIVAEVGLLLVKNQIIKSAVIECPIKSLLIPGITLKTDKNIYHIDVLDNLTCLKDSNIPHGFMNLKLRLLSHLQYQQILINKKVFTEDFVKTQVTIEEQIMKSINSRDTSILDTNFFVL